MLGLLPFCECIRRAVNGSVYEHGKSVTESYLVCKKLLKITFVTLLGEREESELKHVEKEKWPVWTQW
jgi:hypothetical protein